MSERTPGAAARIEGGMDAIVLGGSPDALAAAGLLAKGGFHTALIDPEDHATAPRPIAPGYFAQDGEPILTDLDGPAVGALDLYRHGLVFAERRLETLVRFSDGASLILPGDPRETVERIEAMSLRDARPFAAMVASARADLLSAAALDDAIDGLFEDHRLDDLARAEAALGHSVRSSEPYSLAAFARRYAGDALGLPGALGLVAGGEPGLFAAVRRAAQAAGVRFRQTTRARAILVEWDAVAGVEFDDAAQMRAPAIIAGGDARRAFLDLIGRKRLNIAFAAELDRAAPRVASLRVHIALSPRFLETPGAAHVRRRLLFAPSPLELARAFAAAHDDGLGDAPVAEATFPSIATQGLAAEGATASILLHPAPVVPVDADRAKAVAIAMLDRLCPGASAAAVGALVDAPTPASPPPPVRAARAAMLASPGLDGYFFCGAEALAGRGAYCGVARRVAEQAAQFLRHRST